MIRYKKFIVGMFLIILLLSGLTSLSTAQEKRAVGDLEVVEKNSVLQAGKGWIQEIEGLKIAYYSGSPREIGRQHGLLLIDEPEKMKKVLFSLDPSNKAEGILEKTGWFFKNLYARYKFYPDFKRHTRDEYLEEMKGFVEGASCGEDSDIYDVMMGTASQDISLAGPACSATAAWGNATKDGEMYVGRNLDHKGLIDLAEYQHIAFYNPDSGQQFVVHNYPSFVGTMSGMNESGIMISSNYSISVKEEMTINGLPYMLMLREVLQYSTNLDEAINIIKKTPRTIGLNLMLASAKEDKAVVVELTANHLTVRESNQSYIFTTNMFQSDKMKEYQASGWLSSALRDKRFAELNEKYFGEIDEIIMRNFMRDKFDENSPAGKGLYSGINSESNLASMVFAPGKGKLWVGLPIKEGVSPYPADGKFIEIDVGQVWEKGQPLQNYNTLAPTTWEDHANNWLKVRDAEVLVEENENKEALKILNDILAENPEAAYPQFLAGRIHNRLGNYEKGLEYLNKFIDQPEHPEPYRLLQARFWGGLINDILGRRDKALSYYQKAIAVEIEDMASDTDMIKKWSRKGLKSPLKINEDGEVIVK